MSVNPYEDKYPKSKWRWVKPDSTKLQNLCCCGVKEIHGIENQHSYYATSGAASVNSFSQALRACRAAAYEPMTMEEIICEFYRVYRTVPRHRPFWLFTDSNSKRIGQKVADYIHENNLGTVIATAPKHNDNSGNNIVLYVWTMNALALRKHVEKLEKVA